MATTEELIGLLRLKGGAKFERELKKRLGSAKRSFAGLSKAIAGGGAFLVLRKLNNEAKQLTNAFLGLKSVARFKGVEGADQAVEQLEGVRLGLVNNFEAAEALKNLLSRGYKIDQAINVLNRLSNSAAFNRASHLTLARAVVTATEGLKNENSILVDNAGVTKNVSVMWKEYAKQIGKSVTNLTQQEKIQAEVTGIMNETAAQVGDLNRLSESAIGKQARLAASSKKVRAEFGIIVQQFSGPLFSALQKVTSGIRALSATGKNLVLAGGGMLLFFKLFAGAIQALFVSIGPVGWLITGVSVLGTLFFTLQSATRDSRTELAKFRDNLQGFSLGKTEATLAKLNIELIDLEIKINKIRRNPGLVHDAEGEIAGLMLLQKLLLKRIALAEERLDVLRAASGAGSGATKGQLASDIDLMRHFHEIRALDTADFLRFLKGKRDALVKFTPEWIDLNKEVFDLEREVTRKRVETQKKANDARERELARLIKINEASLEADKKRVDKEKALLDKPLANARARALDLIQFIQQSAEAIGSAVVNAIRNGQDALKAALRETLVVLLEFVKRKFLLARISAILEAAINPLAALKSIAPLAIATGLLTAAQGAITTFADGGLVTRPTLSVIGDSRRGPELVAPRQDFLTVARELLSGELGGRNFHQGQQVNNFNFGPLDERRFVEQVVIPQQRRERKRARRFLNQRTS